MIIIILTVEQVDKWKSQNSSRIVTTVGANPVASVKSNGDNKKREHKLPRN